MTKPKPYAPPKPPTHASVCPGRRPEMKYQNKGQAKNAIAYTIYDGCRGGQLWQWEADLNDWILLYDIPAGTNPDDLPWRTNPNADYEAQESARERWRREKNIDGGTTAEAGAGA